MTCIDCGHRLKVSRETVLYQQSGLPGVRLRNVEVRRCGSCGYSEQVIDRIEKLHQMIAHHVAVKKAKLTTDEVRFLRKWLGWDRGAFAQQMDVTPETVSRWETGSMVMSGTAERLLRLMVLTRQPKQDYTLEMLKDVGHGQPKGAPVALRERNHVWELTRA